MNRVYTGGVGLRAMISVDDNPNRYKILIDRDTAMKPIPNIVDGHYVIYCPRCHNRRFIDASYKFCPDCGQRLDWSNWGK